MWKNVLWFTALGFLRPAIQLFLLPLYLVKVAPAEYGILALVLIFSTIISTFCGLKLDVVANIFYFDYNKNRKLLLDYIGQIYTINVFLSILYFVVFFFFGTLLFQLIFKSEYVKYFPYGVIAVATALLKGPNSIYYSFLKNEMKVKEFVILNGLVIFLTIALQAVFILQFDLKILGILLGSMIPVCLIFLIIIFRNNWLINFRLKNAMIKPSVIFGLSYVPISFLIVFDKQVDKMVMERYLDIEQVGLYAILVGLVGAVTILLSAYESAIRPVLFQSLKNQDEQTPTMVNSIFGMYTSIGIFAMSGILLIGSHMYLLTDNPKYLSIVQYFPYVIGATVPLIMVRFQAVIILFYKQTKYLNLVTFFKTLIMIAFMLLLIPRYGIYGAIVGLLISYVLYSFAFRLVEKRVSGQLLDFKFVLIKKALFIFFLCGYLYLANQIGNSISSIIIFIITSITIYFFERRVINKITHSL